VYRLAVTDPPASASERELLRQVGELSVTTLAVAFRRFHRLSGIRGRSDLATSAVAHARRIAWSLLD